MQYLKEDVRENIKKYALEEFKELGYKGASIRTIAKKSNTSVGNIYKYFESKDELFENLIGVVYHKVMEYIEQFHGITRNDKAQNIFYELMEKIMEIFEENSVELAILLNKSQGSKYGNCKNLFVEFITGTVTDNVNTCLIGKGKKIKDNFIIYLLAYSLVESISIILKEREDGAVVRKLIISLIDIFYKDIDKNIELEDI